MRRSTPGRIVASASRIYLDPSKREPWDIYGRFSSTNSRLVGHRSKRPRRQRTANSSRRRGITRRSVAGRFKLVGHARDRSSAPRLAGHSLDEASPGVYEWPSRSAPHPPSTDTSTPFPGTAPLVIFPGDQPTLASVLSHRSYLRANRPLAATLQHSTCIPCLV